MKYYSTIHYNYIVYNYIYLSIHVETDSDDEWEDVEEEVEDNDMITEHVYKENKIHLLVQQSLGNSQLHLKIQRWCQLNKARYMDVFQQLKEGTRIIKSIDLVQSGALETTTNIVSTFPLDIWGGTDGIGLLWSGLLQIVKFNSEYASFPTCDTNIILTLFKAIFVVSKKCSEADISLPTGDILLVLFQIAENAYHSKVRSEAIFSIGGVGRMVLKSIPSVLSPGIELISVALKERICKDNSLLVVLQSLDVMFDLLGADECPLIFLTTPDLVPLLQETYRNITARRKKESLNKEDKILCSVVHNNLPHFIEYVKSKQVEYTTTISK